MTTFLQNINVYTDYKLQSHLHVFLKPWPKHTECKQKYVHCPLTSMKKELNFSPNNLITFSSVRNFLSSSSFLKAGCTTTNWRNLGREKKRDDKNYYLSDSIHIVTDQLSCPRLVQQA